MFTIDFKNKRAVVSGGGRGIGLGITEALAAGMSSFQGHRSQGSCSSAGADVVITYISKDPSELAKSLSEKYGVNIHVYKCPGENSSVVNEVVEAVSKEVGEVDYVVANAGLYRNPLARCRELILGQGSVYGKNVSI